MSTMTDEEMEQMMAEIEVTSAPTPAAAAPKATVAPTPEPKAVEPEPEPVVETPVIDPIAERDSFPEPTSEPVVEKPEPTPAPKPAPTPMPRTVAAGDGTALNTFIDHEQVKADISINTGDLDTAMIEHPGLELHYAMQTAHARRQFERLKSAVEILEAKIDANVREQWIGEKKPTEAAIKAAVLADKRYSSAQSKLIDAQHIWKLCEATENAFRSRKDLLLEVARDRRKEKEGQMRVFEGQEMRESVLKMLRESKAA